MAATRTRSRADHPVVQRKMPRAALDPTPVRYMGTKRALGPVVRDELLALKPEGPVADLFSGMGSVAASLASRQPVLTNDLLTFTTAFARARFLDSARPSCDEAGRALLPLFRSCQNALRARYGPRIAAEKRAKGSAEGLRAYMRRAPHVGGSPAWAEEAAGAKELRGSGDYRMTTLYFSSAYFSTPQAIALDALRYAIDETFPDGRTRDWVLAAWLSAAGLVLNAPGHSAQFLKPTTEAVASRIARQWSRPVWGTFLGQLEAIGPLGTREWRAQNMVTSMDALDLVESPVIDQVGAVYADPPYTVDHYSRFYHVYETLYRYDFPASEGAGRYRADRFFTGFSHVSQVQGTFRRLIEALGERKKPLVVSYPADGVLAKAGADLASLLGEHYTITREIAIDAEHSTMGASKGTQRKATVERVYVCKR
jgi:adenine-specific DNA-methyltransferase